MVGSTLSALRYVTSWSSPPPTERTVVSLPSQGGSCSAVLHKPLRPTRKPLEGWVVLHGMTRAGSKHPSLERFARALVGSGGAVLIPEIPQWRDLDLNPTAGQPTIEEAIRWLSEAPFIKAPKVVLVGFSFGCPQALRVATTSTGKDHLKGVVGFGGFGNLMEAMKFQFTGRHTWAGKEHFLRPDPYGRWIVGANYLPCTEGCEGTEDVASALRELAILAGDRQIKSWDPSYVPIKERLRKGLAPGNREIYDLFAPANADVGDQELAAWLTPRLVKAARTTHPGIDPLGALKRLPPVRLVHGTHDHLIPYTETLRLAQGLPKGTDKRVTITDLFAHSGESTKAPAGTNEVTSSGQTASRPRKSLRLRSGFKFFHALQEIMALQGG